MPKGVYDRGPTVRRGVWKKAAKKRAKTMARTSGLKVKIAVADRAKPAKRTAKSKLKAKRRS